MSKIYNELYQRFHEFKPVKRGYKKQEESDWYYVDPRYKDDDERGQINVASENSINPRLNGILADDLSKNSEDYYIWRTQKDEKVRGKHAEREGKIFNKHIPPEGGNPGEDNNCRCWAEPYKPEKIAGKQQLVDLSGLDMFKEHKAKSTKLIKQHGENDKAGIKSDADYGKKIDYSLYGKEFTKEFIDEMENDAEFQKILNEYIIPNEGGYSDRNNDRGGKTKYGISSRWYHNEDISNLTRERANAIIYRDFYKWNGLNKLPYQIRGFVVDYGMPTSPLNAIKTVHKVLNLPSNGTIIGQDTLGKLKDFSSYDYEKFLNNYKKEMRKYYYNLVNRDNSQQGNLIGWLKRANKAHLAK